MSLADNYVPTKTLGNGSTTIFTFNWSAIAVGNVVVIFENVSTGVQTVQSTGFTVVLDADGVGGTVTFSTAPASTVFVIIARDVASANVTSYQTSSGFQAQVVETNFDSHMAVIQQQQDAVDRCPKTQLGGTQNVVFPEPENGLYIRWTGTAETTPVLENVSGPTAGFDLPIPGNDEILFGAGGVWSAGSVDDSTIELAAGVLQVKDAGITEAKLASAVAVKLIVADAQIKGWVSLNGTGTIAIKNSFNVSSIVDNGVGDYTINWDTDFADSTYAPLITSGVSQCAIITQAVGSTQIQTRNSAGALTDTSKVSIWAIGDQ